MVEAKNMQVLPALYNIINKTTKDEIGLNSPAVHALWTLHGLGVLDGSNAEALGVVTAALRHPAAGVRKAALQVLPKIEQSIQAMEQSGVLNDPQLNTRLAAMVAIADMPPSKKLGQLIYQASLQPENSADEWISKALLAAAITHEEGFLAASKNSLSDSSYTARVKKALSEEVYALPRRGTLLFSPDVSNKEISIRGNLSKPEQRDLEGVFMAQGDNVNGYVVYLQDGKITMLVKQDGKSYTATSTGVLPGVFDFVATLQDKGKMTITVNGKVVAKGKAAGLFTRPLSQNVRVSQDFNNSSKVGVYEGSFNLRGNQQNASLELAKPAAKSTTKNSSANAVAPIVNAPKAVTLNVKVVPNVMKFNKTLLTVKAGQRVTINLDNPDVMQHNMVIIKPGSTQKVGAAADALARDTKGAQLDYIPRMPEVLYFIKLLNPDEEGSMTFVAPSQPGDYPFICTFPGHWRIMNGILRVR